MDADMCRLIILGQEVQRIWVECGLVGRGGRASGDGGLGGHGASLDYHPPFQLADVSNTVSLVD